LPVPATPLIGRDEEAAAVEDLVVREGARLITLTGPGGIGKSRLAVEAARRLGQGFRDGVRFADLGSVSAAGLVADAIAAALPVNTSGANLRRDVESYLRTHQLLLVLDNFEQVVEAAPLVAELLGAASGLVVLVTSRTVLRLSGEHEFPVSALTVPDTGAVEGLSLAAEAGDETSLLPPGPVPGASPGCHRRTSSEVKVSPLCPAGSHAMQGSMQTGPFG
jgi:predicted ATPase